MEGENNFKPHSGKWELYSLKDKKTSFASLSSISSSTWWNLTCLPVLFGLFYQKSGQSLSLIHSPTAILNEHIKASAEKVSCQTPLQRRSDTPMFFFLFFCLCKRPCLFPPKHKSQPPARWQREQATKRCHPMVSPGLPLTQRWGTTGHLLQEAPSNRWQGCHTHTSCSPLSTASPHSPNHS